MLSKKLRLTKRGSFNYVYKKGQSVGLPPLKLCFVRSSSLKIGFSVSNKVGKAVVRNKIKRMLRASLRQLASKINGKYQMVFIARDSIVGLDFAQINLYCRQLLFKSGLLCQ